MPVGFNYKRKKSWKSPSNFFYLSKKNSHMNDVKVNVNFKKRKIESIIKIKYICILVLFELVGFARSSSI